MDAIRGSTRARSTYPPISPLSRRNRLGSGPTSTLIHTLIIRIHHDAASHRIALDPSTPVRMCASMHAWSLLDYNDAATMAYLLPRTTTRFILGAFSLPDPASSALPSERPFFLFSFSCSKSRLIAETATPAACKGE